MSGGSSSAEKCGFVAHLLMIWLGGCYLLGLALSGSSIDVTSIAVGSETNDVVWVASHPIWNRYLPTASLGVFLIAPIIYSLLNHRSAPPPHSVSSLQDGPTYACATTTSSPETSANSDCTTSIPAIRDLDVTIINDLVWSRTRITNPTTTSIEPRQPKVP